MNTISPLQPVNHPIFDQFSLKVSIKRDDMLHPIISGNKWRKLKYNLENAIENKYKGVLSFGGSYSNHIHALAFACHQRQINSIGIIRGEPEYQSNFTLSWAKHWNMELHFVDRKTYRQRAEPSFLKELQLKYPDYYIVPEGGSNNLALLGVAEVTAELKQQCQFDTLMTPVGSGGTLAGLISGDNNQHNLLGIATLKQSDYLHIEIKTLLGEHNSSYSNWQIMGDYHCGGYGKFSQEHSRKIREFSQQTGINFEPVYSGKMILALLDLIQKGYFPPNHHIVLLHTGGLQGLGGLAERKLIDADEWPVPMSAPANR